MRPRTFFAHRVAAFARAALASFAALAALAALAAMAPRPADAQLTLPQSVKDPQGRFTINFPVDWEVATRAQGIIALIGAGPANAGTRPTVNVVVEPLPNPMPAKDYAVAADRLARAAFHNYTVIQESSAAIQGRPAFYRYLTWETNTGVTLYQLQVFLTEGQSGFVLTGSTINDHDRILADMPLITQIIQTFRVVTAGN
jgi:hypothetical protein